MAEDVAFTAPDNPAYEITVTDTRPSSVLADLGRVPIRYVLEAYDGKRKKPVRCLSIPNGPASVQIREVKAESIQRTFGRAVLQRAPTALWQIAVTGRSGLAERPGYDKEGGVISAAGPALLYEFRDFLSWYDTLAAEKGHHYMLDPDSYGSPGFDGVYMVFRALDEGLHLRVSVGILDVNQSAATSRLSKEWTLQMQGYAPADAKAPKNMLGPVADWAKTATAVIGKAANAEALCQNVLTNAKSDLNVLRAPVQKLTAVLSSARKIIGGVVSILALPKEILADLAVATGQVRGAWEDIKAARFLVDETTSAAQDVARAFEASQDSAREAMTLYGGLRGGPASLATASESLTGFMPVDTQPSPSSQNGTGYYTIKPGDTLQSIAAKYLGSESDWVQLAYLNGLPDAWSAADGSPIQPGMAILLPGAGGGSADTASSPGDIYGSDAMIDWNTGDMVRSPDGNDVLVISGLPCVEQGLTLRLTTVEGQSVFAGYGLPVAPGDAMAAEMAAYVAAHVREQALEDPRIASVDSLSVQDDGDAILVRGRFSPVQGAPFTAIVPFPA
uniref:LysM domain n=1 Tax=uncultured Caudovirales phage TaxID=2100421 RepID=A0A6J5L7B1_9CAUD|nr:LysM domain [uncultured Caudovirales phage]